MEGRDHCFCIKTADKMFYVSAPSAKEKQNWMNSINFNAKGILKIRASLLDKLRDPIVHRGWLEKKGQKRRNWKRRYMTLNEDDLTLTYFENDIDGGSNKKGEVNLKNAKVEKIDGKSHDHCFVIVDENGTRDFLLAAPTNEDCEIWIQHIQDILNQYKKIER